MDHPKINIPKLFYYVCRNNHLELAEKLLSLMPIQNAEIDLFHIFNQACQKGHLEMAQLLVKAYPNIHKRKYICEFGDPFCGSCINGRLEVAKWLYKINPDIDVSKYNNYAFQETCSHGHLEVAQWLLQVSPLLNISSNDEFAFRLACTNGRIEVVKWLLQIKPDIHISTINNYAFMRSCVRGHLHVSKLLFQYKSDIIDSVDINNLFEHVCMNGHYDVAQWIESLFPDKFKIIGIIDDGRVQYKKLKSVLQIHKSKIIHENEKCPICQETDCEISTTCNHQYCLKCISTWVNNSLHNNCPNCRHNLNNTYYSRLIIERTYGSCPPKEGTFGI